MDGASSFQKFFKITLPMLNPTVVLVVVLSTIGGFSLFIEPYICCHKIVTTTPETTTGKK
ncbi:hypothetical protein [Escherichia coli]|uniref:hypothetical protein n=1 Tax=Escherichia coli TaxID=562 RepID=UPI0034D54AA6